MINLSGMTRRELRALKTQYERELSSMGESEYTSAELRGFIMRIRVSLGQFDGKTSLREKLEAHEQSLDRIEAGIRKLR